MLVLLLLLKRTLLFILNFLSFTQKPIERKCQPWSFNSTMNQQLVLFFPILFRIQRENIMGKFIIKKFVGFSLLWTGCLVGDFFVLFFVLFSWGFSGIVGRGIAWPYYWHNQKFPLMLMARSVDGVIFMFKIPRTPGDTVLNSSRTESVLNLQSHIDQWSCVMFGIDLWNGSPFFSVGKVKLQWPYFWRKGAAFVSVINRLSSIM